MLFIYFKQAFDSVKLPILVRKMIEKLTPQQESLIPIIRDKWIKLAIKKTNTPHEEIQKNMAPLKKTLFFGQHGADRQNMKKILF